VIIPMATAVLFTVLFLFALWRGARGINLAGGGVESRHATYTSKNQVARPGRLAPEVMRRSGCNHTDTRAIGAESDDDPITSPLICGGAVSVLGDGHSRSSDLPASQSLHAIRRRIWVKVAERISEIPITEQLVEAVPGSSLDDAAPKGLGWPANKPLMRKPRVRLSVHRPDRVITGDTFIISGTRQIAATPHKPSLRLNPHTLRLGILLFVNHAVN